MSESLSSGGSRGRVRGSGPPKSDLTLVWDLLTGWFFLMKRALHFSTKLNSRDIKKCNGFVVPCYDLFASVFSQSSIFRVNGDRRSEIEKHVVVSVRSDLPQKSSTVLSEPKIGPPIKYSWIRPCCAHLMPENQSLVTSTKWFCGHTLSAR